MSVCQCFTVFVFHIVLRDSVRERVLMPPGKYLNVLDFFQKFSRSQKLRCLKGVENVCKIIVVMLCCIILLTRINDNWGLLLLGSWQILFTEVYLVPIIVWLLFASCLQNTLIFNH